MKVSHQHNAAAGPEAVSVLLDVTPLASSQHLRTGLARVALCLAEALGKQPGISLSTCAWGSIAASMDFQNVRREFPHLAGVAPSPGLPERWYRQSLADRRGRSGWLVGRIGQAINLLRNPLRGIDLGNFDLIHSTYARFPRIVRRSGKPRVITVHDLTPLRLPSSLFQRDQRGVTKRIIDGIQPDDLVACVSEWTRRDFLDHTGHPPHRAVTIPNGVDHRRFAPVCRSDALDDVRKTFGLSNKRFLLTLSSLAPHKNLRFLVDLWPQVRQVAPDAVLVLAGGKTRAPAELRALLGAAEIGDGIILTGFVTDEQFSALASACQAFVFPSLYEGFGLPILEAMACGAPVIASNSSSIPEVTGNAAVLLEPTDSDAWTAALAAACTSPLREQPDAGSTQRAQAFSWDATAASYAQLYRQVRCESGSPSSS